MNINVEKVKHEVKDYIQKKEPEVEQDIVRAELEEIFSNQSIEKIKKEQIDKEYVATIVAERKGVSRERALKAADSVEEALNNILRESNIMEIAKSSVTGVKDDLIKGIENRIRKFLEKINRPELNYETLKSEFEIMLHNPKEAPEVLKRRIGQFDRNTLAAILTAITRYSMQDIDRITGKFEEAKANVMQKIDIAEREIKNRMEEAKVFAWTQAENTRKTTSAAAWWLFATFVLTGIASALGGMAAL